MINYEMALSEIEMYKKAHESLSENLTHANKKAQQYKAERDTLIDDIAVLKANISRLERENRDSKHENKALREQNYKYCKLGNHIRLKAEINPSVDRYIDLVNYIDRLERVNDEKI